MAIPANSIILFTVRSTWQGQRILFTSTWKNRTSFTGASTAQDLSTVNLALGGVGTDSLIDRYLLCLPTGFTAVSVRSQVIYPTRSAFVSLNVNAPGGVASPAPTGNVAGTVTLKAGMAGRSMIGTKHIGPLPGSFYANGLLSNGCRESLDELGNSLSSVLPIGGGPILDPVIYHKNGDGPQAKSSIVETYTVGDTARTMRRRTVGLGE